MFHFARIARAAAGGLPVPPRAHSVYWDIAAMHLHPNYKWHAVGMLWFTGFFNYADRQAIFSLFPILEREFGLDPVQLGLLGSSFALVYGVCAPAAGLVVDRVRKKGAVLAGLYAWSLICMATGAARNFGQLLFFRAAEGLGETFYFPAATSIIGGFHGPRTRSRALGLHQTSVYMGTIAGGFFGGLIGQAYGWRWSFVVFGGLGIALGLVLRRTLHEPPSTAASPIDIGAALRVVWTTPTVLLAMSGFMLHNFVTMVLLTWMPKFLFDRFHLSLAMSGLTATVFVQLAAMLGAPLGGWLADRLRVRFAGGRLAVQAAGMLCSAPFVVWCGQTLSVPALIAALTFWGLFKGIYDANIFASVFDVVPAETRGTVAGFMNFTGWLMGAGTAPVVIGYIAKQESLGFAISAAAVALAAGAAVLAAAAFTAARDAAGHDAAGPRGGIPAA